ncbi:cell division protein ZapC [Catenovulum sp. 2E275]|uniref:cell division protein ZapC n=1 Tax=Catenovulum sp. 2E275 TaxID=2980497 RepID=UPI0021D3393B|nr:cell division protein ZapC [Catenovulum sp. 2E275]MCU4676176.1 cell division protein ZapC [Catenovulum sp. 2E275]
MLQAKADWYWWFDEQSQTLRLNMTEFVFVSACKAKKLIPDAKQTRPFSIEDNQTYCEFYNTITEQLNISEAGAVQIALNALAQHHFVLDEQPKSWYFLPQRHPRQDLFEQVVLIQSQFESGTFFILEECQDCAKVMLLSQSLQLTESKSLQQFDVIKVMNNRISSLISTQNTYPHHQNRA